MLIILVKKGFPSFSKTNNLILFPEPDKIKKNISGYGNDDFLEI